MTFVFRSLPLIVVAPSLALTIGSCTSTSMSGVSAKAVGNPTAASPNSDSAVVGGSGTSTTDSAGGGGSGTSTTDGAGACKVVKPLPSTATNLVLQYNWQATGDKSEYSQVVGTPIVGRLKAADAAPTILAVGFKDCKGDVSQPAYLFAIDGSSGAQKWVSSVQVRAWLSPAIGDLNNDGSVRIAVVGMDNLLHVLDANGTPLYASTEQVFDTDHATWPTGLAVADLALDGHVEVIAGNKIYDATNGSFKFKVSGNGFSAVGDTDGKPGLEVVTSVGIFSGKDGSAICTFATGIDDPAIAVMHASDDHAMVLGVAGDPMDNPNLATVLTYDGKTCAQVTSLAGSQPGGGPINVADFNGDGVLDVGTAGNNGYMAFGLKASMWTTATEDRSSQVTGSTSFDFNGSGQNKVIYADEISLHVFDGATGKELYTAPHASYTARETPVVADVTGSGKARIVVAANSCLPGATISGIRVFKDAADSWVQTRPIWNQHAYNPLLVTASGGLTGIDATTIWKPWLSAAYLAGFRNNIPQPSLQATCK